MLSNIVMLKSENIIKSSYPMDMENKITFIFSKPNHGTILLLLKLLNSFKKQDKTLFISLENDEDSINKRFERTYGISLKDKNVIVHHESKISIKEIENIVLDNKNIKTLVIDCFNLLSESMKQEETVIFDTLERMKEQGISIVVACQLGDEKVITSEFINNIDNMILIEESSDKDGFN